MRFVMLTTLLATLLTSAAIEISLAQAPAAGHWIWFDEGNPAEAAPAGKVWFRREVRADEPSTGSIRIACDDTFTLWVNGQKIGTGGGTATSRFILNGIVDRGPNVIAIEAENAGERAGLLVLGEVRGQSGRAVPFDSGPAWRATRTAPQGEAWLQSGFDDADWTSAKDLGAHEESPWKEISLAETYLDRFQVPEGFKLQRVAEPDLAGSLVCMAWGNRGRLFVSREKGPIMVLSDKDGDGVFDDATEFSPEIKNCQGLCMVGSAMLAVGEGPKGAGMYRLPDRDNDDKADEIEHLTEYKGGIAEHGPHDVVLGPDGWLYHNLGNHAWIKQTPEPSSPIRAYYEGDVLQPRLEDPNGHAVGVPAPGGTIWRFTPDGQQWFLTTNGFRNHYDIAFNALGELFTFDSDMEWEVGMPFYRPIRVYHCTPGAEFGWRSGAGKWLPYYLDSLPPAAEVGRGSPTGVIFYEHRQFPAKHRGAFIVCDWSMGRILSVPLSREGSTFKGQAETLVSGNPLNVSDVEVDRDGSLIFCTGGRGTEGGVYRLSYVGEGTTDAVPAAETIEDALALPQPSARWSRELAGKIKSAHRALWEARLTKAARSDDPNVQIRALTLMSQVGPTPPTALLIDVTTAKSAEVRGFAAFLLGDRADATVLPALGKLLDDPSPIVQRRACEALVRSGLAGPPEALVKLM
ncbi:MAG: HEAT repeat domain-containing protein, partial [Pirellulales bacterium]